MLSYIEINPTKPAQYSVIWLHGLGADGHDFVPIVSQLNLPETTAIRFIFPHAPVMPVTINGGYEMRAWFDLYSADLSAKIDYSGVELACKQVNLLIEQEESKQIPSSHIFIGGFSQGGAIALMTCLHYSKPLGGALGLSTFLPSSNGLLKSTSTANHRLPIFIAHGTTDPIVPYTLGKSTYETLVRAGYPVTWHSYAMPHSVSGAEIADIRQWLLNNINQK